MADTPAVVGRVLGHGVIRLVLRRWAAALVFAAAQVHAQAPIVVAATPNPNVFPLLLAMQRQPALPVRLIAVGDGVGLDRAFAQGADAVVALTPTIASRVASGALPPLRLTDIALWRGATVMVVGDVPARTLGELKGRGFIVSGPTSGGRGGGADLLLRAALARQGLRPDDLKLCYIAVRAGVDWLLRRRALGEHANCEPDKDVAADAMLLVEPAAGALALLSRLPWQPRVDARLPLEPVFSGFRAWPAGELPLGGLAVRTSTLGDAARAPALRAVREAYAAAIDEINAARGSTFARWMLAREVAAGFERHFGTFGLELPALALAGALGDGRLRYRRDVPVDAVRDDLARWLAEVVGREPPPSLLR